MRLSRAVLGGTTLAVLLAGASGAHADPIPWTYNWSRSPSQVPADAPGTGYITLTDEKLVQVQIWSRNSRSALSSATSICAFCRRPE